MNNSSSRRPPRRTGTTPGDVVTGGGAPWYRRWWALLLVFPAILLGLAGLLLFFFVFSNVPLPDDIQIQGTTVVLDVNGEELGTLDTSESRRNVTVGGLPEHVVDAVLAAEDRRFYDHSGVSPRGIARALVTNVRTRDLTGQGGSTITQQYVKNALLSPEQTFSRKIQEAALSIKLERAYSKDEILGFYLSTIYWGRGAYGVDSAARTYYGVPAEELSINQAATLAGIIRSPENLDPADDPEAADARRVYTLDGMLTEGMIDQATHDELVAAGLPETTTGNSIGSQGSASYFLDAVRREASGLVEEGQLYNGLTIRTQMVPAMQQAAQEAVAAAVAEGEHDSGALVAMDPRNGAVVAAVGGPDFETQQLNLAVQGGNQVGSTFKPITLTRFVTDGYSPESEFDAPATIEIGDTEFRNYGGSDFGEQTVREATLSSTNSVYLQMQQEVGSESVIDTAVALGLPSERSDGTATMQPTAGLTLGQDAFTVTELTNVYATLAAGGARRTAHYITEIQDRDGRVVWSWTDDAVEAVDSNVAAVVNDVLVDNVRSGTGTAAALEGRPVAGKTGTSNDSRDAWFAGYTPQLAAAVWVGNLDDTPTEGLTGGGNAAPIWRAFAERALADAEVLEFDAPDLDGLEELNTEPEACPDGYTRREAPSEDEAVAAPEGEGGAEGEDAPEPFVPDVIDDGEDLPCVEDAPPSPSPSPLPTPRVPAPGPSPSEDPVPLPSDDPSPSPDPSESPSENPSPSPSEGGDGDGDGEAEAASKSSSPSPDPSTSPSEGSSEG